MDAPTDTAPPPAAPERPPRRRTARIVLAVLIGLSGLLAGLIWLGATTAGLVAVSRLAGTLSGGRLDIGVRDGRLIGPFALDHLEWRDGATHLRAEGVDIVWAPAALAERRLDIGRLDIARLRVATGPSEKNTPPPADLLLPLAITVTQLRIGEVRLDDTPLASGLAAAIASDGRHHRLQAFRARVGGKVDVSGEGHIDGAAPMPVEARADLKATYEGRDFSLALTAAGPLAALELAGRAGGAVAGQLTATLTPFGAQPFSRLSAALTGLDPAAWAKQAPHAAIDLDIDLRPRPAAGLALGGSFTAINRQAGRLDAGRLPLARVGGRLAWDADGTRLDELDIRLHGDGSLRGQARLADETLSLELRAEALNAAALHGRLRASRLAGPLSLRISPQTQTLSADLADPTYRLGAQLSRQGERIVIESIRLAAGTAELRASGQASLAGDARFGIGGELLRFDPSRFADLPAARLNAQFSAAGTLQPSPAAVLSFTLQDSRFRDQPLAGRGTARLDWPQVRDADIALQAGDNRLTAQGAFGRPDDRLKLHIDAPRLAPFGVEGSLRADLVLRGTPQAPGLDAHLDSPRLALPGRFGIHGLRLDVSAGLAADAPLRLDLSAAAVDSAEQAGALRKLSLLGEGTAGHHTLRAEAVLARHGTLAVSADGGLAPANDPAAATHWRGELRTLRLAASADAEPTLALRSPAPLRIGADAWAVGPADLAGREWRGRLSAHARDGRLHGEAAAQGERIGEIVARLDAGLAGAWALDTGAPWQGKLQLAIPDLAWIGALLGEGWRTGGRLDGDIALAGTPAHPLANGTLKGNGLGVRLVEQGLNLQDGRLAARLNGERLHIDTLEFTSPLAPPPRRLRQGEAALPASLYATPGRLRVSGEIAPGSDSAALDVRLERLGVFQRPDQWIVLSGQGRLRWQDGHLGADGRVGVDAGYWEFADLGEPSLSDDVVVLRNGEAAPTARRPNLDIDLEIDLGSHVHFHGAGVDTRLAGGLRLKSTGRDLPRAIGSIRTVGGRFDAYGQKLDIERGIVNFQGTLDNPGLNVRAIRTGLAVEAGVEVGGTARRPVVKLVSTPEVPDAEKLSWLVLGHGSEQIGGGDASVLIGAAGALFGRESSGGLMQRLQQRFGLDEFGLRQGQVGQSSARPATSRVVGGSTDTTAASGGQIVTLGKRLSANTLLSYEQALGRTESIVKLTVNLTRQLSLIGRTGSDNAIDLFYTFRFGN